MKKVFQGIGVLAVAGLLFVLVKLLSPDRDPSTIPSQLICKKAPDFNLPGLSDKQVSYKPDNGSYSLVNFWASWCPSCDIEHPHLLNMAKSPPEPGFHIVGVLFQDETNKALREEKKTGKVSPTALDEYGELAVFYGVRSTPESFVVNPQGYIVEKFEGPISRQVIEETIQKDKKKAICPGS